MRIDVFSIFPEFFVGPLDTSLTGRARDKGIIEIAVHDPRDHTHDRHRSVDDEPFGGGAGMVMAPGPIFEAVEAAAAVRPLFLLSAAGDPFDQAMALDLASGDGFSLICGRYEGVDQRVADHLCDGELSVGDYVLAGGEAAALIVIEAVTRLLPGVMGNAASGDVESHSQGLLEYPQYTRPARFRGLEVPEVLRSGDHDLVRRWRRAQALRRTTSRRPDLLDLADLSPDDRALLDEFPPA